MIAAIVDAVGPFLPVASFCQVVQWWYWCRVGPKKGVKPAPKKVARSLAKVVGL